MTQLSSDPAQSAEQSLAIRAIKYLLFSASIIPAIVAGALAQRSGSFEWLPFGLALLALFLGQAGADYLYYYFTHYHSDPRDAHTKIFSGWRPLLVGTLLQPQHSLPAGIILLGVDALIGVYFFLQIGAAVIYLALVGGAVAVFFTPLMLRGLKEPVIFFTFGPLCMFSVYYVLTRTVSLEPIIASLPVGMLVTVVAYLKGTRYRIKEEGGGIELKLNNAAIAWLLALAYGSLILAVAARQMPGWALLGLLSAPLAVEMAWKLSAKTRIADYLWATVKSLILLISTGLLLAVGYLVF